MKKLLALLLVLSVFLAGCGKTAPESSVAGTVEPATEATVATEEETPTEETIPAETAAPADKTVTMGRLEGGTYTNAYAGYGCEMGEDWTFYGAEELQELPENVKEAIADTEIGDLMEDVSQFTDMMAENVDQMLTVNVLYQKHTMQERLAFSMMSEEELIDGTLEEQDMMIAAYAQAGMNVESMERITVTFLGEERAALRTVGTVTDVPFYMVQIFDYHLGQYSVTLTANSYLEDNTQQILDLFYPVN